MASTNPFYQRAINPAPGMRVGANANLAEFTAVQVGFDKVKELFGGITSPINVTSLELSFLAGATSPLQAQIDTINSMFAGFAPLASPVFTGVPRGPTAAAGGAGDQLATLDFVNGVAMSTALPGTAGQPNGSVVSIVNGAPRWARPRIPGNLALNAGLN